METRAVSQRYSSVAITLHWLIALMLGGMIALGKNMHASDGRPVEWMFQLHKSVGITILVLMIARLIWRVMNKPPALPDNCLLYTSPSPRDQRGSRMPSSA